MVAMHACGAAQLWGAMLSDKYKAAFQAAVGSSWDACKNSAVSLLTGTSVPIGKQVVLIVPDRFVPAVLSMLGSTRLMTLIRVKNPSPIRPPSGFGSSDGFMLTDPPTPASYISENYIRDTTFNGDGMSLSQAIATVGADRLVKLAGYMLKEPKYIAGNNGPAHALLYLNGDGSCEVWVKIWGESKRQLAASMLKPGPVSFDVTVKNGTYKGVTSVQFHCNAPHFPTPLGGPGGLAIA